MFTKYTNHGMSNCTNQYGHEFAVGESMQHTQSIFKVGERVRWLTTTQKKSGFKNKF